MRKQTDFKIYKSFKLGGPINTNCNPTKVQEWSRTKTYIDILVLPKILCENQTGQRRRRNEIYERTDKMHLAEL